MYNQSVCACLIYYFVWHIKRKKKHIILSCVDCVFVYNILLRIYDNFSFNTKKKINKEKGILQSEKRKQKRKKENDKKKETTKIKQKQKPFAYREGDAKKEVIRQ